jgi:hypothetical protein
VVEAKVVVDGRQASAWPNSGRPGWAVLLTVEILTGGAPHLTGRAPHGRGRVGNAHRRQGWRSVGQPLLGRGGGWAMLFHQRAHGVDLKLWEGGSKGGHTLGTKCNG